MKRSSTIFIILILIFSSVNIFAVSIEEGIELFYKGEYEASKKIFEQIHSTEKGKVSKTEGLSLKFLGNIYWQYYDYRTAERFYIEALLIFNSLNDNIERANTLNNLGTIYMMQKEFKRAKESYDSSKILLENENDFTGVGHILLNIAVLYEKQEKYKDSEKTYLELSKLIEDKKIKDPELLGNLHLDRGKLFFRLAKPEEALKDFVKANFIYTKAKLKIGIVISLINMGITQRELKNYETAVKLLNRARKIIEEIRGDISLERSRATFLENKIFVYEQLASLYIILNQNELSFKTVERAKAKTFVDLIGSKVVGEEKYSGEVKGLIKKEKELSFKIASKIDKEDVSSLISEQKNILNQLKQQAPEYSNLKTVTPISLNQLYNILGKDIILVDYFLGTEAAFVFVLKEWTLKVVVLKRKPWEIEERIRKFRQSATGARMNILDKSWQDDVHWLYKALFEPIEGYLSKDKLICIVPHRM
ncbi:hypothetical protein KAU33_01965, partial [Candidatus Dependentiae bacterium]|nr:hypothetical protein [Candidatus Dependentiae bacterium]